MSIQSRLREAEAKVGCQDTEPERKLRLEALNRHLQGITGSAVRVLIECGAIVPKKDIAGLTDEQLAQDVSIIAQIDGLPPPTEERKKELRLAIDEEIRSRGG